MAMCHHVFGAFILACVFSLFFICKLLFSNSALAVHNPLSSAISDSLPPNQFLCPPIFLLEGQFFLSIAQSQKDPLTLHYFPISFLYVLFSSVQFLFKCSFKSPMLDCLYISLIQHYPPKDVIPVSIQLSPFLKHKPKCSHLFSFLTSNLPAFLHLLLYGPHISNPPPHCHV